MKTTLITTIEQAMLKKLDNAQLQALHEVLVQAFKGVSVTAVADADKAPDNTEILEEFLSAKRIEGCSEKSLNYYRKTITVALDSIGKGIKHITTDDLRAYLTDYQAKKKSSKVTMDNIRRILSSFFSWLEDEDFILKSPVRRIHKVKTGEQVKETISDENMEILRDNCKNIRDLAIIDLLSSTGMRVGELVKLNRSDVNFNGR